MLRPAKEAHGGGRGGGEPPPPSSSLAGVLEGGAVVVGHHGGSSSLAAQSHTANPEVVTAGGPGGPAQEGGADHLLLAIRLLRCQIQGRISHPGFFLAELLRALKGHEGLCPPSIWEPVIALHRILDSP